MTKFLSLIDFKTTGKRLDPRKAEDVLGIEEGFFHNPKAVWVYDDSLYILEEHDGYFSTLIERDEFRGDLHQMESRLYFDWYCFECATPDTTEALTTLLDEYCKWVDYPLDVSANELLQHAMEKPDCERSSEDRRRINWLERFVQTWEEVQAQEDEARNAADEVAAPIGDATAIGIHTTWQSNLPMLLLLYTDGSPEGRAMAEKELRRMATVADMAVEQAQ